MESRSSWLSRLYENRTDDSEVTLKILVTAASKYGSTNEIAHAIGDVLAERGLDTTVSSPEKVEGIEEYDAVVLGSAVYAGHWEKPALELVERAADTLARRPVWLFSSGPVGVPPKPEEDPVDVADTVERTKAREHRVFPGKIDKTKLSFPEKAIVLALRVKEGDFRDWGAVRGWASEIARALQESPVS
jgi:menaquinone-dependent protoporphyrinogen oxidase